MMLVVAAIPAELRARLRDAAVRADFDLMVLLLDEVGTNDWWAMMRPGKRARLNTRIDLRAANGNATHLQAVVTAINENGGKKKLDNKRDEVAEDKWKELGIDPPKE